VVRHRTCVDEHAGGVALLRARFVALNHAPPIAARMGVAYGALLGELAAQVIVEAVRDGTMRRARGLTPPATPDAA